MTSSPRFGTTQQEKNMKARITAALFLAGLLATALAPVVAAGKVFGKVF